MDPWTACLRLQPSPDKVENGASFEAVDFDFANYTEVIVPADAQIEGIQREGGDHRGTIFVVKSQDYQGEAPRPLKISELRSNMGVAMMVQGTAVAFATFGTWSSDVGGGTLQLRFQLPLGTTIARHPQLSGLASLANLTPEGKLGPSYSGASGGWTALECRPAPESAP